MRSPTSLAQRTPKIAVGQHRFVALGLVACLLFGCSTIFGIDVPPLAEGLGTSGEGGISPNGGQGTGDVDSAMGSGNTTGGGTSPAGGAAGSVGGSTGGVGPGAAGGSATGAGARGGRAGSAGTAVSSSAGGAGGCSARPTKGAPCCEPGALACPGKLANSSLICEGGTWAAISCLGDDHCDQRTGVCSPPNEHCTGSNKAGDVVCETDNTDLQEYALTCGPDLVSVTAEACVFHCGPLGCDPPAGSQLILEQGPPIDFAGAFWPTGTVSVCVTNPERSEWAFIREEADGTWGRYAGLRFSGWGTCPLAAPSVELTLRTDDYCVDELGAIDRVGYPGSNGKLHVDLCLHYFDADMNMRSASEPLLRLVARHELGHVLGFDDVFEHFDDTEFMSRGIDSGHLDSYGFFSDPFDPIAHLQDAYGAKPPGSVVDTHGHCLRASGTAASLVECEGSAAQSFVLQNGQLMTSDGSACVYADESGASSVPCTPAGSTPDPHQAFATAEVEVRGFGAECLAKTSYAGLQTAPCDPVGTEGFTWLLDWVDAGRRIRIRDPGTQSCVVPIEISGQPGRFTVALDDCDVCDDVAPDCAVPDRFEVTHAGQISQGGRCFASYTAGDKPFFQVSSWGPVQLEPCSLDPSSFWTITGHIANGNGLLLTRSASDGTALLAAPAMAVDPSQSQIFDFHFNQGQ
jgi:hypothetical protein